MSISVTKRLVKGSPLTAAEHDANLTAIVDALDNAGGTGTEKVQSAQAGGSAFARLQALVAGAADGDTLLIDESTTVTAPIETSAKAGLTVRAKRGTLLTMSGATNWGSSSAVQFALGFFNCTSLLIDGLRFSMNSAVHGANYGQYCGLVIATDGRSNPSAYVHTSQDVTLRNVVCTDATTPAVFFRQVARVTIERSCQFFRPAASIGQNIPIVSVLDGYGHRLGGYYDGGVPDAYGGGLTQDACGLLVAPSDYADFWNMRANSLRVCPFMMTYQAGSSFNAATAVSAANAMGAAGVSDYNWTVTNPEIQFDYTRMTWWSIGVGDVSASWGTRRDPLQVTGQNIGARTVTLTPRDFGGTGSVAFYNQQLFFLMGLRESRMPYDVQVKGATFRRTRGVGVFLWLVRDSGVTLCYAEDCLDIGLDAEFVVNCSIHHNVVRRTAAIAFTTAYVSVLYGSVGCSVEDNELVCEPGASLYDGIELAPKGYIARDLSTARNRMVGGMISVYGRSASDNSIVDGYTSFQDVISGSTGADAGLQPWLYELWNVRNARILQATLDSARDHSIRYMGCEGLEVRDVNTHYSGQTSAIAYEANNPVTGVCDSRDVRIIDCTGWTVLSGAALVNHQGPPVARPTIERVVARDAKSTSALTARTVERHSGSTALVPEGTPFINLGQGWLRNNAGVLQFSTDSTDNTNGTWATLTPTSSFCAEFLGTVTAKTITLCGYAPAAGKINGTWVKMGSGTATVAIQIGGVSVTSNSALSASTTGARTAATGANTFAAGARITAVITSPATTPTDLEIAVDWSAT